MESIKIPICIEIELKFKDEEKQNVQAEITKEDKPKRHYKKRKDTNTEPTIPEEDNTKRIRNKTLCSCGKPWKHMGRCKGLTQRFKLNKKFLSAKNNPEHAQKLKEHDEYMEKCKKELEE